MMAVGSSLCRVRSTALAASCRPALLRSVSAAVPPLQALFGGSLLLRRPSSSSHHRQPAIIYQKTRRERVSSRHFSSQATTHGQEQKRVEVEYRRGVPYVLVPLPSQQKQVLFALRPLANTIDDFVQMIKKEDQRVSSVSLLTKDNVRIASSNSIADVIDDDFRLMINDKEYYVKAPERSKEEVELERLTEIRSLVSQLYSALNAGETSARLEHQLQTELNILRDKLEPLEKKKRELDLIAGRRATALTWIGLGMMSVQFGILARLTWWEYSWDIMEPVTYFVTYGTAMAAYAYFVLTRQDYVLPDVRDRQHLLHVYKRAAKVGLNLDEYNQLKDSIARLELDLSRVKDPLSRIPIQPLPKLMFGHSDSSHRSSTIFSKVKSNFSNLLNLLKRK